MFYINIYSIVYNYFYFIYTNVSPQGVASPLNLAAYWYFSCAGRTQKILINGSIGQEWVSVGTSSY